MAKPAILAVDDDRVVRSAVERDLRRQYGKDYRILSADGGAAALEVLKELKLRGNPVALLLADQRMPQMTGVEFLAEAIQLFPDAKRLLLTAYADTEVAIRAINEIRLDHYLMKPWDPPEERLYPVINDQLEAWEAQISPRLRRHSRDRPPLVAAGARRQGIPGAQPDTLPLARHRGRYAGRRSCWTPRAQTAPSCPS